MKTITIEDLKELLQKEKQVIFSYIKKDGAECMALGTLDPSLIIYKLIPEKPITEETTSEEIKPRKIGNNFRYYDINKSDWRSISSDCSDIKYFEK